MVKRTPELFEKIERYIKNTLPETQRESFEKEIDTNPALKSEIEKHREVHANFNTNDVLDFRKKLIEIENQLNTKKGGSKRGFKLFRPIAASLLLLIGVSIVLFLINKSQKGLFENYYEPYPVEDVTRGESSNFPNKIALKYSAGKYEEIILDLEQLVKESPKNNLHKPYLGNSYLNLNKEDKAIRVFSTINENIYKEEALWYTALCYLKINDIENTKSALNNVVLYNGIYKKNALELLGELKIKNPDDF